MNESRRENQRLKKQIKILETEYQKFVDAFYKYVCLECQDNLEHYYDIKDFSREHTTIIKKLYNKEE